MSKKRDVGSGGPCKSKPDRTPRRPDNAEEQQRVTPCPKPSRDQAPGAPRPGNSTGEGTGVE